MTITSFRRALLICLFIALMAAVFTHIPARAAEKTIIGWRHDTTGAFPDAKTVDSWSPTENVIWKTKTDKWSNASPVILKDRIFICEEPSSLVCLNRADGTVMWRRKIEVDSLFTAEEKKSLVENRARGAEIKNRMGKKNREYRKASRDLKRDKNNAEFKARVDTLKADMNVLKKELVPFQAYLQSPTHNTNGYTSMTPVTDGQYVVVFFGIEAAACFDLQGKQQWARRVEGGSGTPSGWGHSCSPVIADGMVIVHVNRLHALDLKTGETVWEQDVRIGWGTPIIADVDGLKVTIPASGEILRVKDGKKLTSAPLNRLEYNSAAFKDGIVYFIQTRSSAFELKRKGDTLEVKKLWEQTIKKDRYYASPLIHEGLVYDITQAGILTVLDAKDGKEVYTHAFKFGKGTFYTSVTLIGNQVLVANEKGRIAVFEPGRDFKLIGEIKFEAFRSSPVALDGRIYLRGLQNMYCIGK
ncbi:PQQ-binding-like beta-propeller repeat protein [Planctomycetota bacterium]